MRKFKNFIRRFKCAWVFAERLRFIHNGATNVEEVWIICDAKANRKYFGEFLHRIA